MFGSQTNFAGVFVSCIKLGLRKLRPQRLGEVYNSSGVEVASYAKKEKFIGRGLDAFGLKSQLLQELTKRTAQKDNLSLLEIGCGQGNLLLDLLALFPGVKYSGLNRETTHGVRDQSDVQKRAAERGLPATNLPQIYFGEATGLPFGSESFDLVVSQVTFMHIENKARALEEAYRVLKPGGQAMIGLGSYSIRRKQGHAMPPFYKLLRRELGEDFNPRFLIRSPSGFVSLSEFVQGIPEKLGVKLQTSKFVSESQRGIAQWLVLDKKDKEKLDLGLRYDQDESRRLTSAYAKKNPVNWGVIDFYHLKEG